MTTDAGHKRRAPAPLWYLILIAALEARRYAAGLSMEQMDRLTGIAERSYTKAIHPDAPSGRCATPPKMQAIFNALFPHGIERFDIVPARPGSRAEGRGVENSPGAVRSILRERAFWDRKLRRQHMRELGKLGGQARARKLSEGRRIEIATIAGRARAASRSLAR